MAHRMNVAASAGLLSPAKPNKELDRFTHIFTIWFFSGFPFKRLLDVLVDTVLPAQLSESPTYGHIGPFRQDGHH